MQTITPTKTGTLRRHNAFGPTPRLQEVITRARPRGQGLFNPEAISPNWLLLLILVINIALWAGAIIVADQARHAVCGLDQVQTHWIGKTLCR